MILNLKKEDITKESVKEFFDSIDVDALMCNIDNMMKIIDQKEKSEK